MNSNWKKLFAYTSSAAVEQSVNGNTIKFYPNRIGLLTELAEISKPVTKALATLFGEKPSMTTSTSKSYTDKPKKDIKSGTESAEGRSDEIVIEAVQPAVADHRRKTRDEAIDQLIDALTDGRNRILFGKLLMDSMRDEFSYKRDRDAREVEEFLFGDGNEYEGIDAPTMADMVKGWARANAKVFGPMGEKMVALVRGKLEVLREDSPSNEDETASTTDGSSSRTLSLVPLDSDSELNGSSN